MNLRSVLGFSFLTACSAVPPAPEPTQMDADVMVMDVSGRADQFVVPDVVADTARPDAAMDRIDVSDMRDVIDVIDVRDAAVEVGVDVVDERTDAGFDRGVDVIDVAATDVVVPSRMARRLGDLPCAPTDIDYFSDTGAYLLSLCPPRQFFQVRTVFTSSSVVRRNELPAIADEELRNIVATTEFSAGVLGINSLYQVDTDSEGTRVRLTFPASHHLTAGGLFLTLGSQNKFYVGTFYSDTSFSGGEILTYTVNTSGAFTPRLQSLADGGVTHQHVSVDGTPVGMTLNPSSVSIIPTLYVLTASPGVLYTIQSNTDRTAGGRLPTWVHPIAQSELQVAYNGRYVVFANQDDGRIVFYDSSVPRTTTSDGVSFISLPPGQIITDVRTFNNRVYASTRSGTVYVYSIPEGVLQETITTESSPITAAEVVTGTSPQILFAGAGGLYAANL